MSDVIFYLEQLLKNDDTVVVGVSGGPDSMCLLHLLSELKFRVNIVVAHVNHKLREEADREADFVRSYCKEHNLFFEYMEIKEYNHGNVENYARCKRYEFFNKLISKYQAKYLMTAHHGDDLMETILMRLVRGSSIKGYSGFKEEIEMSSYKLVRPLIRVTKSDIETYMNEQGYKYFVDATNYSSEYTRNRFRLDVLPFLKQENSRVHLKFLKFSQELDSVNRFVDNYIKELMVVIEDETGIKIDEILKLDKFLLKKVIEYKLDGIYNNDLFRVQDKHVEAIISLISGNRSNGYINLPNGLIAKKNYNYLEIVYPKDSEAFSYELNDEVVLDWGVIRKIDSSDVKSNFVIRLNSKDIKLPIIVRSRQNGDRMQVKNLRGSRKVKDILIDEKIEIDKRKMFPVVTDSNNEILWLPGVKKSKFDVERCGIYDIILSYEEE